MGDIKTSRRQLPLRVFWILLRYARFQSEIFTFNRVRKCAKVGEVLPAARILPLTITTFKATSEYPHGIEILLVYAG